MNSYLTHQLIAVECRVHAPASDALFGSDNGLWDVRHRAIIWTYAEMLVIKPFESKFKEILI